MMRLFAPSFLTLLGVTIVGLVQIILFGHRHADNLNALALTAPMYTSPCSASTTRVTSKVMHSPIILDSMAANIEEALLELQRQRKQQGRKATFVQIGANDGVMFDQLYPTLKHHKSDWIGLMVEPQPLLYSKLVVLHADARDWSFYQGVLTPSCENGTIVFCQTTTPGQGNFRTQGQLSGVKSQDDCAKTPGMVQVPRPCVSSYEHLLEKGNAAFANAAMHDNHWVVDLLQIDTEGHDYPLIQMISSEPTFTCINFEHAHMGNPAKNPRYNDTLAKLETLMDSVDSKMEYTTRKGDTLACRVKK